MNILLVNPGRHVALYEQLMASDIGPKNVYIAENDITAASCLANKVGKNIKIAKALDQGFIKDLLDICGSERINHLFSFLDYGLDKLATEKDEFRSLGTEVVASSLETVRLCEDKMGFFRHMEKNGIGAIPTFADDAILKKHAFPYFAKPRFGNSSFGVSVLATIKDLRYYLGKGDYIIQPYINGKEYGIDLLVKNGEIYDLFMKEKFSMRAGTTDKAMSVWIEDIFRLVKKLVNVMEFEGPIDIDIFENNGEYLIGEINPRFGGGYSSAILCGKNFFWRYLKDRKNENPQDYKTNVRTVRYEKTIAANDAGKA